MHSVQCGNSTHIHLSIQGYDMAESKQQVVDGLGIFGWKGWGVSLGDESETILLRMWSDMKAKVWRWRHWAWMWSISLLFFQKGNCVQLETLGSELWLWHWVLNIRQHGASVNFNLLIVLNNWLTRAWADGEQENKVKKQTYDNYFKEYELRNTTRVSLNLSNEKDADIIKALDGETNIQGTIKRLIRNGLESGKWWYNRNRLIAIKSLDRCCC